MNPYGQLTVTLRIELPNEDGTFKFKTVRIASIMCAQNECEEKIRALRDVNSDLWVNEMRLDAEFVTRTWIDVRSPGPNARPESR
jgi:hypothetical protein